MKILAPSTVVLALTMVHECCGETWIHRDWAGVTTWVGRVRISSRRNGRTVTSVRVGNNYFHDSNFGLSGVTYQGTSGRVDVLSNSRNGRSRTYYWPDSFDYSGVSSLYRRRHGLNLGSSYGYGYPWSYDRLRGNPVRSSSGPHPLYRTGRVRW